MSRNPGLPIRTELLQRKLHCYANKIYLLHFVTAINLQYIIKNAVCLVPKIFRLVSISNIVADGGAQWMHKNDPAYLKYSNIYTFICTKSKDLANLYPELLYSFSRGDGEFPRNVYRFKVTDVKLRRFCKMAHTK